ncbi:MAG: hypothetical protein ABI432_00325 [Flavobacteriales bacterium]
MATVKMGVDTLPATGLVAKAQGIHDSMVGNAKFPNAVPTPAALQGLIDALVAANAGVDKNGGKVEHQARREADKALRAALKEWAGYVQMASSGDEDTILSSGFEVRKKPAPIGALNPPTKLVSLFSNKTGRASFRWDREEGADLHHVFMSTSNNPFKWELIGATTKSRFNADSLEPRTMYWFAVTAIGAAGETSLCEPLLLMAAA